MRVHFQRDDRAADYRVEVTYLKGGAEASALSFTAQQIANSKIVFDVD